jgi:hypothetical protein
MPSIEEVKLALYRQAEQYWADETDYYGYDLKRPENVIARMKAIKDAVDVQAAQDAFKRCKQTMEVMILGAWASGKIPGPTNVFTLQKRAKKAENLALMLERKGLYDQANSQRARARELRRQLDELLQEKSAS